MSSREGEEEENACMIREFPNSAKLQEDHELDRCDVR